MAMQAENTDTHAGVTDKAKKMVLDVKSEMAHEVHRIHVAKEPVDPTQSDHVVRRHVPGLSISFFVAIGIFLLLVIAGIAIYTNMNH